MTILLARHPINAPRRHADVPGGDRVRRGHDGVRAVDMMWLSLLALAVMGAADTVSVVIRVSLVQLATPDEMRGRVSAVNFLFINASNQLGEFESGVTAALLGTVPAARARRHRNGRGGADVDEAVSDAAQRRAAGLGNQLAAADERHLGRHDRHEQHIGVERQAGHVDDGVGDVLDVHRRFDGDLPLACGTPSAMRAAMSVSALPMSIWPQAMS